MCLVFFVFFLHKKEKKSKKEKEQLSFWGKQIRYLWLFYQMQTTFLSCVESKIYNYGQIYARFHLGTFLPGQGLTVANALRRTLLSDLPGIVITSIHFQGADHEFAILSGVQESLLDIVLNLKQLVFRSSFENFTEFPEQQFSNSIFVKIKGPAQVTAADLKLPPYLACVDPTAYIATVSPTGELAFTLELKLKNPQKVTSGMDNQAERKLEKGKIFCLDTVPTPVRKINYLINEVESKKDSEYISLEIWTDGSIHPTQALEFSLKKLTKLFFNFMEITQEILPGSKKEKIKFSK